MRLLDLPVWLRAYGLEVTEVPGWKTRGAVLPGLPSVVVGHHTATSARATGDLPTLGILRDGRNDLPGPLCQVAIGRSGLVYVVASGKANHAGRGEWNAVHDSWRTVGIEVEHPGTGPWEPRLLQAFDRTAAALLDGLGQPAHRYCGHREWALPTGRKVDPGGVDLRLQRDRIRRLLLDGPNTRVPPREDDDMTPEQAKQLAEIHAWMKALGAPRLPGGQDRDPQRVDLGDLLNRVDRLEQSNEPKP